MSGILGVISAPHHNSRLSQHDLLAMRDSLAARGTSASDLVKRNQVVFATRYFTSPNQPGFEQTVFSSNGRFGLVVDGDLFQLDSLRGELERAGFRCHDHSIGSVLMNAWLAWGKSFVRKLYGTFAIGIVDLLAHRCFLFRDRVGAKPLFYAKIGHEFVFASSIKAIRRHPDFSAAPNLLAIRNYLATLRLTLDDQTLVQNIHTVLPAEIVTLEDERLHRETYWTPEQPILHSVQYRDSVNELEDHLQAATSQAVAGLRSHEQVGVILSGGVDSSLIANLAASRIKHPLISRCGGVGESSTLADQPASDFQFAEKFSREHRFDHRSVKISCQSFREAWHQLIVQHASPLATPNELMLSQVANSLKGQVSILLAAEGADEVFCGYSVPHWAGRDYENSLTFSKVQSLEAEQTRQSLRQQYGRDQFYSPSDHFLLTSGLIPRNSLAALLRPEHWNDADSERSLEHFYDGLFSAEPAASLVEKWALVLFRLNAENLASRIERATAQAGIQVRMPYTDHRLIEFAFRLPHHFKIDLKPSERQPWLSSLELHRRESIRSKRILREVAHRRITGDIANRSKQCAPSLVPQWLAHDWKPWISQTLNASPFFNQFFRRSAIEELQTLPGSFSMWNWPIVNLALWGDQVF
jgi:asparagine synthase (glutamine-hydrolysing)